MSVTSPARENTAVLWDLRKVPFEREPDEFESGGTEAHYTDEKQDARG